MTLVLVTYTVVTTSNHHPTIWRHNTEDRVLCFSFPVCNSFQCSGCLPFGCDQPGDDGDVAGSACSNGQNIGPHGYDRLKHRASWKASHLEASHLSIWISCVNYRPRHRSQSKVNHSVMDSVTDSSVDSLQDPKPELQVRVIMRPMISHLYWD